MAGLGDLGSRVVDALAREPAIERLIAAGRDAARGAAVAGQAALTAQLLGGPSMVAYEHADLEDVEATAALLGRVDPDIIVVAASYHTWWRSPDSLPYAVWLPLQLRLVRRLMEAHGAAGIGGRVVCLPYPDVVIPALRGIGLAPDAGGGNVAEVAAKLRLLASAAHGTPRDEVDVRLVMHHAVERIALGAFESLGGGAGQDGDPPWAAEVRVRGRLLPEADVGALFHAPYPLPPGRETHGLTAAATVALVRALLTDEPCVCHVPGAAGLPGGYPAHVGRGGIELALPEGISRAQAVDVNQAAGRWDGVEQIEDDGTVIYTAAAAQATEEAFGHRVDRLAPGDHDAAADELLARRVDMPVRERTV